MGEVSHLVWVGRSAVSVGGFHLGVNYSSDHLRYTIEEAFEAQLIEDEDVPPNYSILEGTTNLSRSRPMYRVFDGCINIFTTASLGRAIAVLQSLLEEHLPREPLPAHVVRLAVLALIGPSAAVLAPYGLRHRMPNLEQRIQSSGLRVLDRPSVLIDANDGSLVVPQRRLYRSSGTEGMGPLVEAMTPGRISVVAWLMFTTPGEVGAMSRALGVARGMAAAHTIGSAPTRNLALLARLAERIGFIGVRRDQDVVSSARTLIGGP
jgi:hypothetical protein